MGPPIVFGPEARPQRAKLWLRRFQRSQSGAGALDFALVATPLIALLVAILETCILFFAQEYLQTAATQTSRLIMTGQAQGQSVTAAQFKQDVCNATTALFSCSGIYVNIQTFSSFSSVSPTSPLQNGNFNSAAMGYSLGGPGDVEIVQVYYQWPVILGALGFNLANMNGNYNLIVGTAVFRNEPYH